MMIGTMKYVLAVALTRPRPILTCTVYFSMVVSIVWFTIRSQPPRQSPEKQNHLKHLDPILQHYHSERIKLPDFDLLKQNGHPKRNLGCCNRALPSSVENCDSEIAKFVEYDLPRRTRHSKRNLGNCDRKRIRFALAYEARSEANTSADNEFGGPSLHNHKYEQDLLGGPGWSTIAR